jgi:hypothetical protein
MAWFLFAFTALNAVGFLFLIDVVPPGRLTQVERMHTAMPCLVTAIGAVLLARRRLAGLPLVMSFVLVPHIGGRVSFAYVVLTLIVFWLPFGTAFLAAYLRAVTRARPRSDLRMVGQGTRGAGVGCFMNLYPRDKRPQWAPSRLLIGQSRSSEESC